MRYDVCILSPEKEFAAMLALELEDRGLRVAVCETGEAAAGIEAESYLVDADRSSFSPRAGRLVRYGRRLADAPPPREQLHRPFLLTALYTVLRGGGRARGLFLAEGERAALLDGERIPLTEREYGCLACLLQAKGKPVSREELLAAVWGESESDCGVVTVYLHYLRKKLEKNGKKMICAIRGRGYALRQEEEEACLP